MKNFPLKTNFVALLTAAALLLPGFTGAAASDGTNSAVNASRRRIDSIIISESVADALKPPKNGIHKASGIAWRYPERENAVYRALDEIIEWFDSLGYDDDHNPETYGGVYRTDDCKLAIWLVGGDPILKQQILDVVTDDSVLVFKNATISWNELCVLKDSLSLGPEMSDLSVKLREQFYFYSVGVSQKYNAVGICVRADPDTAAALVLYNAAYPNIIIEPLPLSLPDEDVQPTTLSDMVTAAADAVLAAGKF